MPKVKHIDHVAMLVEDLEEALSFWRDALGIAPARIEDLPAESSRVAFMPLGESEIELVEPTTDDTGLARFLQTRGPGMHHICLEVDDIQGMLAHLKQVGIQLVNQTPVEDAEGKKYAFIHPKNAHGVLVELYELPG